MLTFKRLGTKRYGDIGNSLYQYSILRLVAEHRKLDYGTFQWGGRWWFEEVASDLYAAEKTLHVFYDKREYAPNSHLHQPEVWEVPDGTDLRGFFTSHRYYWPYREKLKSLYRLVPEYERKVSGILSMWPKDALVIGLQYRFADEYGWTFPILDHQYYKDCLSQIYDRLGGRADLFYVLSADVPLEKLNIDYLPADQLLFVRADPAVAMFAMTYCDIFVMSNSTFSWWTAFLNKKSDALILCPEMFNGIDFVYPAEVYPNEWVKVPVTQYRKPGHWYELWRQGKSI